MKIFGALLAALGGILQLLFTWRMFEATERVATYNSATADMLFGRGLIGAGIGAVILVLTAVAFMNSGRFAGVLVSIISVVGFFTNTGAVLSMVLTFPAGLLILWGGWRGQLRMSSDYT